MSPITSGQGTSSASFVAGAYYRIDQKPWQPLAAEDGAFDEKVKRIEDFDAAIVEWSADTLQSDEMDQARRALRTMIVKLGAAATDGLRDPRAVLGVVERRGGDPPDPAGALAIAEGFGAGMYVLGNIVEVGDRLRFDASLYDRAQGLEPVVYLPAAAGWIVLNVLLDLVVDEIAELEDGHRVRIR